MLESVNAPAGSPTGSLRARPQPFPTSWGSRRALPRPAHVASDVRLRHLEWVVRAGRLALAGRAARALTSTGRSVQRRWVHR